jgi:hypothetical protein
MACFVLEIGVLCGSARPISNDTFEEGTAPKYLACEVQLSTVHVASRDKDDGMFVGLAIVWFGQGYRRRVTFAAAGPTTFQNDERRRNLPLYLPICHPGFGASYVVVPLTDRNVGSASAAALQSGVQLRPSLGTRQMKERLRTHSILDPDPDKESPRPTRSRLKARRMPGARV